MCSCFLFRHALSSFNGDAPLSFSRIFIHSTRRDHQSSAERGLGPFYKKTHFRWPGMWKKGTPLPCRVTSAVCGQLRLIVSLKCSQAWRKENSPITHTPRYLSCSTLKRCMLWFHWIHLQVLTHCLVPQGLLKETLKNKSEERGRGGASRHDASHKNIALNHFLHLFFPVKEDRN